jgi:hypothetical protein
VLSLLQRAEPFKQCCALSRVLCVLSTCLSWQARQEPNEFIVLNAAAYHAGYNMGFNCAEVRASVGARCAVVCCAALCIAPLPC